MYICKNPNISAFLKNTKLKKSSFAIPEYTTAALLSMIISINDFPDLFTRLL